MGGGTIGPYLREYAQSVPPHEAVVEVGAWLGGGTQYLVRNGPLFVYDRFKATKSEVEKAAKFGVTLAHGENTLPRVRELVPDAIYTRGDIREAEYHGPTIGLYVDDASKRRAAWKHSMKVFEPHFRDGTIICLMDHDYPMCEAQREYAKRWTMLHRYLNGTLCAVFRC